MMKTAPIHVLTLLSSLIVLGCSSPVPTTTSAKTTSPEHEKIVRAVIANTMKANPASIDMNRSLSDPPLKADELDLVEMVMELEDRLGISVPDEELERAGGTVGKGSVRLTPAQLVTIVSKAKSSPRPDKK
jgi:acyl carrier protein